MAQTAVEYLIKEIKNDVFVHSKSTKEWNIIFKKSKAMEKEQITEAVMYGDIRGKLETYLTAEEYYNEKYNQ